MSSYIAANVSRMCRGAKLVNESVFIPSAVIGADGFGLANDHGRWVKVPQLGHVIIADDVEIGANTTIDRAHWKILRYEGVKLDNQLDCT
ncbi:MAG: hypothetical protein R3E08_05200 [Thiotrichaceae bacterium]